MTRKDTLAAIRAAGYHNDQRQLIRLYVENRIPVRKAFREFDQGRALRTLGMPCSCAECNPKAIGTPITTTPTL